jgi:hypothetical protein
MSRLADASLSFSSFHGWEERKRGEQFLGLTPRGVAQPGLRRLLVVHAPGGGRRRHRLASPSSNIWDMARAGADRRRRPAAGSRPWPASTARSARTPCATNGLIHDEVVAALAGAHGC